MASIDETISKALVADPTDTPKEAERKALMKRQLDAGTVSAAQIGAELALESLAKSLREKDPTLSAEQAYVKAMDLNPDLGHAALKV